MCVCTKTFFKKQDRNTISVRIHACCNPQVPSAYRRVKGTYNGSYHPCIFQVSNSGTNFCIFFRDMTLFFVLLLLLLFTIFLRIGNFNCFQLVFLTTITITPGNQYLPTSTYIYPNYTCWKCRNDQKMNLGNYVSWTSSTTPLISRPLRMLLPKHGSVQV